MLPACSGTVFAHIETLQQSNPHRPLMVLTIFSCMELFCVPHSCPHDWAEMVLHLSHLVPPGSTHIQSLRVNLVSPHGIGLYINCLMSRLSRLKLIPWSPHWMATCGKSWQCFDNDSDNRDTNLTKFKHLSSTLFELQLNKKRFNYAGKYIGCAITNILYKQGAMWGLGCYGSM